MSLGSMSLGSSALGGIPASQGTLFVPSESLATGVYRRSLEYSGSATFFAVETRMESPPAEAVQRIMRLYSHNDPGETPQIQTTVGIDANYTQSIIGAARFIVVDLELLVDLNPISVLITGQEYFQ